MKPTHWLKRLLVGFSGFLLVSMAVLLLAREALFSGAILPPSPLPTGKIIDMHVHVAGIGAGGSGCYVSPTLQNNFRFNQYLAGFGVTRAELEQHGDSIAVDKMAQRLQASHSVQGAVLLALDGVVDAQGALDLPLLSHTGQERSFSSANDAFGDPRRLELPLSLGVAVIAGHIATTGMNHGEDNYQRILPMFAQYPNLYADISSLTQINKLGFMAKALNEPRLQGRLLYGSDFPLPNMILTSAWYFPLNLSKDEMRRINAILNHWDRDVALKQALGVPPEVFTRSAVLLGIR